MSNRFVQPKQNHCYRTSPFLYSMIYRRHPLFFTGVIVSDNLSNAIVVGGKWSHPITISDIDTKLVPVCFLYQPPK